MPERSGAQTIRSDKIGLKVFPLIEWEEWITSGIIIENHNKYYLLRAEGKEITVPAENVVFEEEIEVID